MRRRMALTVQIIAVASHLRLLECMKTRAVSRFPSVSPPGPSPDFGEKTWGTGLLEFEVDWY